MANESVKPLWSDFVKAIKKEVVPATGCTEPVSLAFAAAVAAKHLGKPVERVEARVSANLMKNGMGVTVPGTGTTGLFIAAAVGALGGNPDGGLEVLKHLTPEHIAAGKRMVSDKLVTVTVASDVPNVLYSEAKVFNGSDWAKVCIADNHTNVIRIEENGKIVFEATPQENADDESGYDLHDAKLSDVFEFATSAPLDMIDFIKVAGDMNDSLSHEGMSGKYGLRIGATMSNNVNKGLLADDLLTKVLIRTSAASDARMGGATLPAMTNSGSGNQGIAATMPVVVVAEYVKADQEQLIRALTLSHLTAIYIHSKLPKLSALCAVTTASMGAAAGMAWLLKGDAATVGMAISSMIGDVSGMICDGAANSCSMKVSTAVTAAYKAVLMALDGTRVSGSDGIVDDDVDCSIANLGRLATNGMIKTDEQILQIMLDKH